MKKNAFSLASARAKKAQKLIPESKKTLQRKLYEIVDDLDLGEPLNTVVNGVELELHPISALSYATGRTPTTLRMWEADKILPKATFRSKSGRRLYAPLQIALVVYLAEKHQIGQGIKLKQSPFTDELSQLWPKIKQMVLTNKEVKNAEATKNQA